MRSVSVVVALAFTVSVALAAGPGGLLSTVPSSGGSPILTELPMSDNPAETLHYDGDNASGVGLTGGGSFRGAVRFTPTSTCTVTAVLFYQRDASQNDHVYLFEENNDTVPGAVLDSFPYTGSGGLQWKRVDLTRPLIVVAGTDFWACVRCTHDSGAFPLGTDAGPMVRDRGGFISTGSAWQQLEDVGLDYNWNIRAVIEPVPGLDHDVGVSRILSPGIAVAPGTYTPTARVTNFGTNAASDIPVHCVIDSAGSTVYDETVTYAGPLQPGTRAAVDFPDWTTGPALNMYDISMFTAYSADLDPSNDTTMQTTSIAALFALLDHDTGYCKLTVSCFGSIGYDAPADAGNGFRYPKTAASGLFLASLAVGNDYTWVVDRHFGHPPAGPINMDWEPVDSLQKMEPPVLGDQHYRGTYDDAGHASPAGLKVTQNSYMSALTAYDDFIVFVYDIANEGTGALNGLYAAVFSDFDVGASPSTNNATNDTVGRFGYMYDVANQNPTMGVKILEPRSFANMAAIDHERYVYPDSCMSDTIKFKFMSGEYSLVNSNRPFDWSLCLSVGPFDLGVGESYRVAYAFVGGSSNSEAQAHADAAQTWYNTNVGFAEGPGQVERQNLLEVVPNPFRNGAFVNYHSRTAGPMTLEAFDATGRMVDTREFEIKAGNGSYFWQPAGLARGVYFLNIRTPDEESSVKVLRID